MTIHRGLTKCAAIYCNDRQFQAWIADLAERQPDEITSNDAAELIRLACKITSRRELDTNNEAAETFLNSIRKPYLDWKNQQLGRAA